MEWITSRKNEGIKQAAKLVSSSSFRKEQGEFLVEGARLCRDAAQSDIEIVTAYVTKQAQDKYPEYVEKILQKAEQSFGIEPHVGELLSDTKTSQGIYCICRIPSQDALDLVCDGHYLALENLQDPANLGAVLRTGEALGIRGVILGGSCCDVYSPKVLRASMGAVFRLPLSFYEALEKQLPRWQEQGFSTLAAVPAQDAVDITQVDFSNPSILAVGNEGNGLTDGVIRACEQRVTIPMKGRAESLNAAASASILMWEMLRGREPPFDRVAARPSLT